MADVQDSTVQILREIRDEIRSTRVDLSARIDQTNQRLDQTRAELSTRIDQTNERLDHVETTLLELATQQRFVVKHSKEDRDRSQRIERELAELRRPVDALEAKERHEPS